MPQYFGQLPGVEQSWSEIGRVTSIKVSDRHLILQCDTAQVRISILATNLIRVRVAPNGAFLPRRSWAVAQADTEWELVPFAIQDTEQQITIQTEQMRVVVSRARARIHCFDAQDQPFA
jgi:alpha-glucosidase